MPLELSLEQTRLNHTRHIAAKWSRSWDFRGVGTAYSEVYTFAMAKLISVQLRGVEKAIQIRADEAKEEITGGPTPHLLRLILDGKPVGEFKYEFVDGWWIEE
jgi:hypothetical protein